MKLLIKNLPNKDLKKFWKMQKEYLDNFEFSYVKKDYEKNKKLYVGAYDGKKLMGIAYGFPTTKNEVNLQGIAVILDNKYPRKGIGSKILKFFENQAKKLGKKKVSLGSAEGYVEKFYLRNKYKPIEIKAKDKNYLVLATEKVKNYEEGLKKREKLRKKFKPKEVIFIMEKKLK